MVVLSTWKGSQESISDTTQTSINLKDENVERETHPGFREAAECSSEE